MTSTITLEEGLNHSDPEGSTETDEVYRTSEEWKATLITITKVDLPDFHVKIGRYCFKMHSRVAAKHSSFFRAACGPDYKEGSDKTITLHDDQPECVARMIIWFYTGDYPDSETSMLPQGDIDLCKYLKAAELLHDETVKSQWLNTESLIHAHMHNLADKYGIPKLGFLAWVYFEESIDEQTTDLGELALFLYGLDTSATLPLRDLLADAVSRNITDCLQNDDDCLELAARSHPDFAMALIEQISEKLSETESHQSSLQSRCETYAKESRAKDAEITKLKIQLDDKDRSLEGKDLVLEENYRQLKEKERLLDESERLLDEKDRLLKSKQTVSHPLPSNGNNQTSAFMTSPVGPSGWTYPGMSYNLSNSQGR